MDLQLEADISAEDIENFGNEFSEDTFENLCHQLYSETASASRFAKTNSTDLDSHLSVRVSEKTKIKERWAVKLFKEWHSEWKMRIDGELKTYDDLEEMSEENLCYTLKFFIADVRKENGNKYPPKTLKSIYYLIQHYLQYECKKNFSLFTSDVFKSAREVLDAEMRLSALEGNVKETKKAGEISIEDEESLWTKGILGCENPKQLQQTIIYMMGIQCGLRAATEHKSLKHGDNSQIQIVCEEGRDILVYREFVSKNKHFGLKQSRMEPKVVRVLPNEENKERCLVSLYKKYLLHRPKSCIDSLHLSCIQNPEGTVWYKNSPLGIHQIEKVTKELMEKLGKEGYFTNTSLRRSAKTRLVEAGIPREVSKRRIGHISNADCAYISQRAMENKMSKVLYGQSISSSSSISISQENFEQNNESSSGCKYTFKDCSFQDCTFN